MTSSGGGGVKSPNSNNNNHDGGDDRTNTMTQSAIVRVAMDAPPRGVHDDSALGDLNEKEEDDDRGGDDEDEEDWEEDSSDDECLMPKMATPVTSRNSLKLHSSGGSNKIPALPMASNSPGRKTPKMSIFMGLGARTMAASEGTTPKGGATAKFNKAKKQFGLSIMVKKALANAKAVQQAQDDEDDDDDDLDDDLDGLDLDSDLLGGVGSDANANEAEFKWKARLKRDEIYSQRYRPSPEEVYELVELFDELNIPNEADQANANEALTSLTSSFDLTQMFQFFLGAATASSSPTPNNNTTTSTRTSSSSTSEPCPLLVPSQSDFDAWNELSGNQPYCQAAVILKRGLVRLKTNMTSSLNTDTTIDENADEDNDNDGKNNKKKNKGTTAKPGMDRWEKNIQENEGDIYELILLSRGLILAKVCEESTSQPEDSTGDQQQQQPHHDSDEEGGGSGTQTHTVKHFARALLWKDHVDWVGESLTSIRSWLLQLSLPKPTLTQQTTSSGFFGLFDSSSTTSSSHHSPGLSPSLGIIDESEYVLEFVCGSREQQQAWIKAMETVLTNYYLAVARMKGLDDDKDNKNNNNSNTNANSNINKNSTSGLASFTEQLGWQYLLIRRPAFTLAVTRSASNDGGGGGGNEMVYTRLMKEIKDHNVPLNVLDTYHGYAPLHYSIRLCNISAMQRLLQAGANPNFPNSHGETPMTMAVQENLPKEQAFILYDMLECFGAKKDSRKHAIQEHERGILLGKAAEAAAEKKRLETAEQKEAARAKNKEEAASKLKSAIHKNLLLMQERGTKVDQLGNKANEMTENAKNFADLARQLKEKSKAGNKGLLF